MRSSRKASDAAGQPFSGLNRSIRNAFSVTSTVAPVSAMIALGLKAVFLVTTVFGVTGLWIAIMADTGATVLVTLNALRMLRFNPEKG